MLVKCAWCKNTFNSERYGRQFCPHCGAELDLAVPGSAAEEQVRVLRPGEGEAIASAEAPVGAAGEAEIRSGEGGPGTPGGPGGFGGPPGGYGPGAPWGPMPPPQDQDSPWERREQLGTIPALLETWKQATLRPEQFFAGLRPDGIGPAFSYGWIFSAAGMVLGTFWNVLLAIAMGEDGGGPAMALGQLVFAPFLAAIGIWIGAGILHLGCLLFRCADRGFDATFRALAFSQGPLIFGIVPIVGGLVGGIWSLVLSIIAIKHLQRTTTGRAAGAALLPMMLGIILCSCLFVVLIAAGFGALAGGMGLK